MSEPARLSTEIVEREVEVGGEGEDRDFKVNAKESIRVQTSCSYCVEGLVYVGVGAGGVVLEAKGFLGAALDIGG